MLYEISLSQFKVRNCQVTLLKFKQSSFDFFILQLQPSPRLVQPPQEWRLCPPPPPPSPSTTTKTTSTIYVNTRTTPNRAWDFNISSFLMGTTTVTMNGHHHCTNTMTTNSNFFPCFLYILLTFFYNLTRLHVQKGMTTTMMTATINGHHQHYDDKQYFFPLFFIYILLTFFYSLTRLHVQNGEYFTLPHVFRLDPGGIWVDSGWNGRNGRNLVGISCQWEPTQISPGPGIIPTKFPPDSYHSHQIHSDPPGSQSYQIPSGFQVDSEWNHSYLTIPN